MTGIRNHNPFVRAFENNTGLRHGELLDSHFRLKQQYNFLRTRSYMYLFLYIIKYFFWLQIQRSRVRFPALPDFLRSSGSGTGYTQPRE
jgi:hypothetical protein